VVDFDRVKGVEASVEGRQTNSSSSKREASVGGVLPPLPPPNLKVKGHKYCYVCGKDVTACWEENPTRRGFLCNACVEKTLEGESR